MELCKIIPIYKGKGEKTDLNNYRGLFILNLIKSIKDKDEEEVEDNEGVLHKGIAKRMFSKSFTIAEDVEIKGAELKDGLLSVSMERVIPEHKKARTINIK